MHFGARSSSGVSIFLYNNIKHFDCVYLININPGNYSRCRNACLISQSEVIAYKVGVCLSVGGSESEMS